MKNLAIALLALFMLTGASCPQRRMVVYNIADVAARFMDSVARAQKQLIALEAMKLVSTEDTAGAMLVFRQIGIKGEQLATALDAVNKLPDDAAGRETVRRLVRELMPLLPAVLVPLGTQESRSQIELALRTTMDLLLTILEFLPEPAAPPPERVFVRPRLEVQHAR